MSDAATMNSEGRPRVPTNLITGFLGVGKTTTILNLLAQRPADERWAVLVNEFGEVGIDGVILEGAAGNGVAVSEIAGGCFCCSSNEPLDFTLIELIRQTQPRRVLIEPTGLGHPAAVLDTLRGPWFRNLIDLRATICVADPADFANPRVADSPVFQDQLHMADIVLVNKTDKAPPEQTASLLKHLRELFPPKLSVLTTTNGTCDVALLDADISAERVPLFPNAHPPQPAPVIPRHGAPMTLLLPGHPLRKESPQGDRAACGWLFSPLDRFSKLALMELLGGSLDVYRLKGVFNVGTEWLIFNRVGGELTCESIPYCRDSRVEVILDQPCFDWDEFEKALLNCLK
jgi:G3E family GTPase